MKNEVSESKKRNIREKKAPAARCVKMRELKSWSLLIDNTSTSSNNEVSENKQRKNHEKKAPAACCVKMRELKSWSF